MQLFTKLEPVRRRRSYASLRNRVRQAHENGHRDEERSKGNAFENSQIS
jgi:hypothetical protein